MPIWELRDAELTTAYTRERLVAAREPRDELTGSGAAPGRIVTGWATTAAGRRPDPGGMGRPGPAVRVTTATTATAAARLARRFVGFEDMILASRPTRETAKVII